MSISAIILAAGKSTRMGKPKMLLPWGKTTVLGKVIETVRAAGIEDIVVVTNEEVAARLTTDAKRETHTAIRTTMNEKGEMLTSFQLGLKVQKPSAEAAMIVLGDQPQVEERSVRSVCEAFQKTKSNLVVPSYQMRRGHPWLVARPLWEEIQSMREPETLRDFLNRHNGEIFYVECGTPTILQDVDTPGDYLKFKPRV